MTDRITLRRPDDWHLHLRDGDMLRAVAPESARHFGRAIIMPNLVPPVVTAQQAQAYRERIAQALPEGADFTPLMTLYLTEDTEHKFEHWSRGQPSLERLSGKFVNPGDVWPESLGYSVHVASNLIYVMTVFDRLFPDLGLGKRYSNIPAALRMATLRLRPVPS